MYHRCITLHVGGVAPLTGSVDRNTLRWVSVSMLQDAPLTGTVDRNCNFHPKNRRILSVAPLTGSVDRNLTVKEVTAEGKMSLPSRGAWIEINTC